jgi:hypothetical protein
MDWSDALRHVKRGKAVKRSGWNGKSQFIHLVGVREFPIEAGSALSNTAPIGSMQAMEPFIAIRAQDGTNVPWLASQKDQLAEDWEIVYGGDD